ncbi:MAG: hypothetical protein NUV49_04295 [Patescibacteria group bacterium]|nr:hypothetical protein [Patescibacteria group bacterium]
MPKFFSLNLHVAKTFPALRYRIEDEYGEPIAITFGQATQEGDAVLFAHAPEMYMALTRIVTTFAKSHQLEKCDTAIRDARKLLEGIAG